MGPREAAACPDTRSEMESSRQALGKASEEGASQSAGRRCFIFSVGSFGPIDIDSELVILGADATVGEQGDAGVSCTRGGDNGAAGADSGGGSLVRRLPS
jgi:hypothetical protein